MLLYRIFSHSLLCALLCSVFIGFAVFPASSYAAGHQGKDLVTALQRVYRFEGALEERQGAVYFVPVEPGLAPVLLIPAQGAPSPTPKDEASVQDVLAQRYPVGAEGRYPAAGFNPGRLRNEALLKALYGNTAQEVQSSCRHIDFFGQSLLFNKRQGAADALERVITKLKAHIAQHPEDAAYIVPSPGTFAWRPVKDTGKLSAHAFGIAIDLNVDKGLYWMWKPSASKLSATRAKYPQAIVEAFESEGFIWGGKWDAFDFMHFEYRPELFK